MSTKSSWRAGGWQPRWQEAAGEAAAGKEASLHTSQLGLLLRYRIGMGVVEPLTIILSDLQPCASLLLGGCRHAREAAMQQEKDSIATAATMTIRREMAAAVIQAAWRGYKVCDGRRATHPARLCAQRVVPPHVLNMTWQRMETDC